MADRFVNWPPSVEALFPLVKALARAAAAEDFKRGQAFLRSGRHLRRSFSPADPATGKTSRKPPRLLLAGRGPSFHANAMTVLDEVRRFIVGIAPEPPATTASPTGSASRSASTPTTRRVSSRSPMGSSGARRRAVSAAAISSLSGKPERTSRGGGSLDNLTSPLPPLVQNDSTNSTINDPRGCG